MRHGARILTIVLLWVSLLWPVPRTVQAGAPADSAKRGLMNPFFAMDTGTKDKKHETAKSQAAMLRELGYAGIGCDIGAVPEMLQAIDHVGLKMFAVYVMASVDPEKPKYDSRLKDVTRLLKGRQTIIWLLIRGGTPSSTDSDARAVEIVREVAAIATASGLRVALYPHVGDYVARVEDAVRVAKKVDRRNVGATFNLCHWLRLDDENTMKPLLKLAMPYLFVVTINGADSGGENWDTLIQPLDRGSFDVYNFLKTLKEMGYTGPIGLQHYGIKGDAHENLKRSVDAWRNFSERLAAEQD